MTRVTTPDVWYRIFGILSHETAKAYYWELPTSQKFWMPKSQCRNLNTLPDEDGHISIEVKEWILDDKAVPPSQRYDLEHPGPSAHRSQQPQPESTNWLDHLDDDAPF